MSEKDNLVAMVQCLAAMVPNAGSARPLAGRPRGHDGNGGGLTGRCRRGDPSQQYVLRKEVRLVTGVEGRPGGRRMYRELRPGGRCETRPAGVLPVVARISTSGRDYGRLVDFCQGTVGLVVPVEALVVVEQIVSAVGRPDGTTVPEVAPAVDAYAVMGFPLYPYFCAANTQNEVFSTSILLLQTIRDSRRTAFEMRPPHRSSASIVIQ